MIADSQTDQLYLADCLPKKQPNFFKRFEKVLSECSIEVKFLPNTKNIWAIDYMPVQVEKYKFVQFTYNSGYLHKLKLLHTISDVDSICKTIDIVPQKTDIVLDGDNVVKTTDKVIISNIIFKDNPHVNDKDLIKNLQKLFQIDKLTFIPWDKYDTTGHADGMVRFLNENTVLIDAFADEDFELRTSVEKSLHDAGLDWIEVPYYPYQNKTTIDASGVYINFLQMKDVIILPVFRMKEDEVAVNFFENHFKGQTIVTVECNEVSKQGGVLHCISWNIKSTQRIS